MEYTKRTYAAAIRAIQGLLDDILALKLTSELIGEDQKVLVGNTEGGKIEITYLHGDTLGYFRIAWSNPKLEFLSLMYHHDTNLVGDSTKFSPNGFHIQGHIQCWHKYMDDDAAQLSLINTLRAIIIVGKQWEIHPWREVNLLLLF